MTDSKHYDKKYFMWQQSMGKIGTVLNKFKFENHINSTDVLMDFGCGGGYLLTAFKNKIKIGFEINHACWDECNKNNITVVDNYDDIDDGYIDCVISDHALEHVTLPLQTLKDLHKKIKTNGKLVIVIPCEQPSEAAFYYKEGDINQHLHTWCPMTLGNLVTLAGFKVVSCMPFQHQWCPDFKENYNKPDFHDRCIAYAKKNKNLQIKLIAIKP